MPRTRRKNWSIVFLSRTWRCRTMRKIRSLLGTVRRPSINAQTLELFLSTKNRSSKSFSGAKDFSTTQFYSQTYRGGHTAHEVSSQQTVGNSKAAYANQTARGVHDASQSGKKVASRAYGGNRPFLDQGTNQKSLNRKNEPLTIEQVRELLNKNK